MKKLLILLTLTCFLFSDQAPPYLTIIGPVNMEDGLGRQAIELCDSLYGKETMQCVGLDTIKLTNVPKRLIPIIKTPENHLPFGSIVIFDFCLWFPHGKPHYKLLTLPKPEDQIRMAYSMFESSQIPKQWVEILNERFDLVVVPDPFLVDVYKNSGVEIPIFELPLGLNLKKFLNKPLKNNRNKPFVFANLGSSIFRKNQIKLIQAFAKAFGNNPDVELIINSRTAIRMFHLKVEQEIKRLSLSNVHFKLQRLPEKEYISLMMNADCLVNNSLGEGYSIQPREAMALGIPVILTDNTAQSTLCQSGIPLSIPCYAEPAYYDFLNGYYGDFFNHEVDDLANALTEMVKNYGEYLSKAEAAREFAAQYDYSHLIGRYQNLIHPKEVQLGRQNLLTEEVLITNSDALFQKYQRILR